MKAKLYLLDNGEPVDFWEMNPTAVFRIGRAPSNHARPKVRGLSRNHAELHFALGKWSVHDLGSTNGTLVNGKKVKAKGTCEVKNGDIVQVGSAEFLFESWEPRLALCPICGEGEIFEEHVLVGDELAREDLHVCVRCGTLLEELEDDDAFEFRFVPSIFSGRFGQVGRGPFSADDLEKLGETAADELDAIHGQLALAGVPGAEGAKTSTPQAEEDRFQDDTDDAVKALSERVLAEIVAEAPRGRRGLEPAKQQEDVFREPSPDAEGESPVDAALQVAAQAQAAEEAAAEAALELDLEAIEEEELRDYVPPSVAARAPEIAADDLLSSVGAESRRRPKPSDVEEALVADLDDSGEEVAIVAEEIEDSDRGEGAEGGEAAEPEKRPAERLEDPDWVKRARLAQMEHRHVEEEVEEVLDEEEDESVLEKREAVKRALMAKKRGERKRKGRHRKPRKVVFALTGIVPDVRRLVAAILILLAVGGVSWGYLRWLEPGGGKQYMVRCKACLATFPHSGDEENAFNLKCVECGERRANVIFVCRQCAHVVWLNSPTELDGKQCPICASWNVGYAHPAKDGLPGTLERVRRNVEAQRE